jgi:hypothetical protein
LEHYEGTIGIDPGYIGAASKPQGSPTDKSTLLQRAKGRALSTLFIVHADPNYYGPVYAKLENQFSRGTDQNPSDLTAAYNLLLTDVCVQPSQPKRNHGHNLNSPAQCLHSAPVSETEVMFTQSTIVHGFDNLLHPKITCFKCNCCRHYTDKCLVKKPYIIVSADTIGTIKPKLTY